MADTVHHIEWAANRLVAEDSTLQDERTTWAVRVERLQQTNSALKGDIVRLRDAEKSASLETARAHGRIGQLEDDVRHAHAESERILVALTTEAEATKAEKRQLLAQLETCRAELEAAKGAAWASTGEARDVREALEQAKSAHAAALSEREASAVAETRRLLGELKLSQADARAAREALDATRLESDRAVRFGASTRGGAWQSLSLSLSGTAVWVPRTHSLWFAGQPTPCCAFPFFHVSPLSSARASSRTPRWGRGRSTSGWRPSSAQHRPRRGRRVRRRTERGSRRTRQWLRRRRRPASSWTRR